MNTTEEDKNLYLSGVKGILTDNICLRDILQTHSSHLNRSESVYMYVLSMFFQRKLLRIKFQIC